MLPPDPQLILDRGQAAALLMADETFLSVVDDLSQYHLAAIVAAPPGDRGREARDHHHLLHFALSEIAGELQGRVQTAEELKRLLKQQEDDE